MKPSKSQSLPQIDLPEGLIDEIFALLPTEIQHHLLMSLHDLTIFQPKCFSKQSPNIPMKTKGSHSVRLNDQDSELKKTIFSNITTYTDTITPKSQHRLCLLHHLTNLTTLRLQFSWGYIPGQQSNLVPPQLVSVNNANNNLNKVMEKNNKKSAIKQQNQKQPLEMSSNHHTYSLPQALSSLNKLTTLRLFGIHHTSRKPSMIREIFHDGITTFPSLTTLDLCANHLDENDLIFLSKHIHCPSLTLLNLKDNRIHSDKCMQSLIEWTFDMKQLESIVLWGFESPGEEAIRLFGQSHLATQLKSFDFPFHEITLPEFKELFINYKFSSNGKLEKLDLSGLYGLSDECVDVLVNQSPQLSSLKVLDLNQTLISDTAIKFISESLYLNNLTTLQLPRNDRICDKSFKYIGKSKNLHLIEKLGIGGEWSHNITSKALTYLTHSNHLNNLTDLTLYSTNFSAEDDFIEFIQSNKVSKLTRLQLERCMLTLPSLQALFTSPQLNNLTYLNINGNPIGNTQAYITLLPNSPGLSQLIELYMFDCNLNDEDLSIIAQSPHLTKLKKLVLRKNPLITDKGIYTLSQSPYLLNLEYLEIGENPGITRASLRHLVDAPDFIINLKKLWILQTSISKDDHHILTNSRWFGGVIDG